MNVTLVPKPSALRCAFCHGPAGPTAAPCPDCATLLHPLCLRRVVACPTLGCPFRSPHMRITVRPRKPRRGSFFRFAVIASVWAVVVAPAILAEWQSTDWASYRLERDASWEPRKSEREHSATASFHPSRDPPLTGLEIRSPRRVTVTAHPWSQNDAMIKVTGIYQEGTVVIRKDVTQRATYVVSDDSVARVSPSGRIRPVAEGVTLVDVSLQGLTTQVQVTVLGWRRGRSRIRSEITNRMGE